jgi:ribose transport system substrate-binding protein
MMNARNLWRAWILGLCLLVVAACERAGSGTSGDAGLKARKLAWVQPLKGHPVHQMTQIAFREACRELGYEPVIIGTDGMDIGGTVALAEQALAGGDIAGLAVWTGSPAWNPLIARAGRANVPVILPHFPAAEGSVPGATGVIACNPAAYARAAAEAIGRAIDGKGKVAITQGSFNELENSVARTFAEAMKTNYPNVEVLPPEEEGFDAPRAISRAVSLLQAQPGLTGAFSTTGGGPVTWAGAQRETGRRIVAIGMDYTRVNLDLVRDGAIYAIVGQPLWDEAQGAARLLDDALNGRDVRWWTELPAPIVTRDGLAPYYTLLDKVESGLK